MDVVYTYYVENSEMENTYRHGLLERRVVDVDDS